MGEAGDDLHRGQPLPKPGLPRLGVCVSPQLFSSSEPQGRPLLCALTHSLTLLNPHPGTRSLRGARLGEPTRAGIELPPIGLAAQSVAICFRARKVISRSGDKGRLTCRRDIGSRWTTMAGMASEGRMRYDSQKISDDLGQPSCRNASDNKLAACGQRFRVSPGSSTTVSTASIARTPVLFTAAGWQRLSPIPGSRRGNLRQ